MQYKNEPGMDAGGVRRQFFSDLLNEFAYSDKLGLFEGPPIRLRPTYNPQAVITGLMRLLGRIIAHSIVLEGIGFCFLSPAFYWYLVSGQKADMEQLHPLISTTEDLDIGVQTVLDMVSSHNMFTVSVLYKVNYCQIYLVLMVGWLVQ